MDKHIQEREQLLQSGQIAHQIEMGHYTVESLEEELYQHWVQVGLADQRAAINDFVIVFQNAHQKALKANFLSALFGWLDLLIGICDSVLDTLIQPAVSAIENGINTWKAAAGAGPSSDFLGAALEFQAELPTKEQKQLALVDNFTNTLRNVPKRNYNAALLAAYGFVTKIVGATISYRGAFNQYYMRFLDGVGLLDPFYWSYARVSATNPAGDECLNVPTCQSILWRGTPDGLDACTLVNYFWKMNMGCISPQTPGLENMSRQLHICPGDTQEHWNICPVYDCATADCATPKYAGCWLRGMFIPVGWPSEECQWAAGFAGITGNLAQVLASGGSEFLSKGFHAGYPWPPITVLGCRGGTDCHWPLFPAVAEPPPICSLSDSLMSKSLSGIVVV